MYQHEYENIKQSLERLKKIEDTCQKSLDDHFSIAEREMYESSREYVEAYEAKQQARQNSYNSEYALNSLNQSFERQNDDEEDECC